MTTEKLPIPKGVFDQHVIVLGKTRSGKSSAMRLMVESLLDDEKPVCIVDPKGDWWGIKSSADGKQAGYPLVIFGGEHADVPINRTSGPSVAELFATGNRPCLVDLGGWMVAERTEFFIGFASTLFKLTRGRRWLVIDEVHNFCPKGKIQNPQAGMMLHWANRLASEGLGKGLAMLAASQRPQKVHNDFLTSCETLIAMRVIHKSDRDAIKDWIDGAADVNAGKEVLATIASMVRGEGWAWSPELDFGPKRVQFPMFSTYDSFRPQKVEAPARLKGWADVDLDDVRKKLATVLKEAEAKDPEKLRVRIRELEKQLQSAPGKTKEVRIVDSTLIARAVEKALKTQRAEFQKFFSATVKTIGREIERVSRIDVPQVSGVEIQTKGAAEHKTMAHGREVSPPSRPPVHPRPEKNRTPLNGDGELTPYQRSILRGLAELEAIGRTEVPRGLAGAAAGKSHRSSTFEKYSASLRAQGLIEYRGSKLALTDSGREQAGSVGQSLSADDVQERLLRILTPYQQEIVKALIDAGGEQVSWDELGEKIGKSAASSTFERYMAQLRSAEIIEYAGAKRVKAASWLFLE